MRPILISLSKSGFSTDPKRILSRIKDYVAGRPTNFASHGNLCYGVVADYIKALGDTSGYTIVLLGSGDYSIHGILLDPKGEVVADKQEGLGKWDGKKYNKRKVLTRKGIKTLPKPISYSVVLKESL